MLARCRVHEVSQEWGCEWGSSYMNESIHSVSSHDCRFEPSRMRWSSLLITLPLSNLKAFGALSERHKSYEDAATTIVPSTVLSMAAGATAADPAAPAVALSWEKRWECGRLR